MIKNKPIFKILNQHGLSIIQIEEILNYLETLDYDLDKTRYIGKIIAKNERLAKYYFFRDQLSIQIDTLDPSSHIHEILDQCIDWNEFWRLLVIKKGFCCIKMHRELKNNKQYMFFCGPNILTGPLAEVSHSIFEFDE